MSPSIERHEQTINWARLGGAAILLILGPSFPNIGLGYVWGLAVFILVYAAAVNTVLRTPRGRLAFESVTKAMFVIDVGVVAFGMLVFAADPTWSAFVVSCLLVIAGGFRFGTTGAFAAAGALAMAYVGVAAYRAEAYGLVVEPPRLAFHVSILVLAAYMMSGLLRELEQLRAHRERFIRKSAEAAALRRVDRAKSEWLAAISHDFRTPLTVVRGAVEILLGERPGRLTSAQRDLAESAARNVRRLEDFTEQLLDMARLEEGQITLEKEQIDAASLVHEVIADHALLAEQKRQWISVDVDADSPCVVADRRRVTQALSNIVVNAIRYAPQGTPIIVAAHRQDGALRIEVRDKGPGISALDRPRIFEKFVRGRNANGVPGSGLGLAIARSLVTLHGGTLEYEDNPGGGAAFVASLPLASVPATVPAVGYAS